MVERIDTSSIDEKLNIKVEDEMKIRKKIRISKNKKSKSFVGWLFNNREK